MGIFRNLFDNKNDDSARLITTVKKIDNGEDGLFAKIQNDLGSYIAEFGENENNLRKMAYAYARRAAAAGLYLQGIWGRKEYAYTFTMFKKFQQATGNTKEFQNEAGQQAAELLESYDSRLTHELISFMMLTVESGNVPSPEILFPANSVICIMERELSNLKYKTTTA